MITTTRIGLPAHGLLGLLLCSAETRADEIGSSFIEGLIGAQLVFEGEVVDVRYRPSTASAGDPLRIPHTFVTDRVDRVYKGSLADDGRAGSVDTLTLRFIGGEGTDDEYLMASGLPLFDIGDRDVLMVAGNGESI
jgi:hypothetical protein